MKAKSHTHREATVTAPVLDSTPHYTPSKILSRNLDGLGRKLVYGGDRYLIAELA